MEKQELIKQKYNDIYKDISNYLRETKKGSKFLEGIDIKWRSDNIIMYQISQDKENEKNSLQDIEQLNNKLKQKRVYVKTSKKKELKRRKIIILQLKRKIIFQLKFPNYFNKF